MEGETTPSCTPLRHPWHTLPEDTIGDILAYFDVPTLVEKKGVSRQWQRIATVVIDLKKKTRERAFRTNQELFFAVRKYSGSRYNPNNAEEIASTYGWPIGRWDVSYLEDLSYIFHGLYSFNEDISAWDVSNCITMKGMFQGAELFNQDVSRWDTSKVSTMQQMFLGATSFDQDLSSWDMRNVVTMMDMFRGTKYGERDVLTLRDSRPSSSSSGSTTNSKTITSSRKRGPTATTELSNSRNRTA